MDAIDVDVKLVLYSMLAKIDGGCSYMDMRNQVDSMYDNSDDSSDDDSDDDAEVYIASPNQKDFMDSAANCDEADSDIPEQEINDKEESDPEEDVDMLADEDLVIPKTKWELTADDLPPIDQLVITPDGTLEQIGVVSAILDKIVVTKAFRFTPALDIDTVLFLENGQPVGRIFETFGPVAEPFYLIRFSFVENIKQLNLAEDVGVFFLPHSSRHTKYVFVDHLRTVKGSDASWEDNNEPPPECLDFSDDEEERRCKAALELEKQRNHYAHFLPEGRRLNGEEGFSSSVAASALPPSVNCDASMFSLKELDRKSKLRSKLVGAALVRARRKAARTNLGNIPSSSNPSATSSNSNNADNNNNNNSNVLSLVEEAVKTNPALLSSIISSALSAASNSQPGGFMPMALPVMLPPSAEAPSQPRFVPTVPTALPPNLQFPAAQNFVIPTAEPTKRRLIDPRFVKKQS